MLLGRCALICFFVALLVAFFIQGCAIDDSRENVDEQQYLKDNGQDPIDQEPREDNGKMVTDDHREKIREILERDIEFAPAKDVHAFELKPGYYEEAAANQLLVRYTRETAEVTLEEVFAVAEKYGAVVTGNRVELRLIQFHAANEDMVSLINDLNKISTIDAYLNMIAYEEE